jgi:hypothetical protein
VLPWSDRDRNGRSEPAQLVPVAAVLAKIGLGYFAVDRLDSNANRYENRGWAIFGRDFKDKPDDPVHAMFEVSPVVRRAPDR